MDNNQLVNVVKTLKRTELVFGTNNCKLRVGKSDIKVEDQDGDELISIYPEIREREYRVLYSSPTLDKHGTSTAQELVDFWESNNFFFDVGSQPIADGRVEFRGDLPVTIGFPALGAIYLVEKPTTILFGAYTTYQSGLYIKDNDTGSLSDWRRLNVKVKYTSGEWRVVDSLDQSKQLAFDVSDILTSTTRTAKFQDRDGVVSFLQNTANFLSTGLRTFAGFAINADPTKLDIGEVKAYFVDNTIDVENTIPSEKTFPANIGYAIQTAPTGDALVIYISVDINGDIVETPVELNPVERRGFAALGLIVIDGVGNILFTLEENSNFILDPLAQIHDLMQAIGTFNIQGNTITPNANLTFAITSGLMFQNGSNANINPKDPHRPAQLSENPTTFNRKLSNGTDIVTTQNINPNQWDNGTSIPAVVPNNNFTVKRIARFPNGGLVEVLQGQELFNTKQNALDDLDRIRREFVIPADSNLSVPLYWLIIKQGTINLSNLANSELIPIVTGNSGLSSVIGVQKFVLISENFESGSFATNGWTVVNGVQTNKWHVGVATAQAGANSAYISNDGGVSNAYNNLIPSVVHFYKDFTFPTDAEDCYLSFWFKGEGEDGFDFMNVFVTETTVTPVAGSEVSANHQLAALDFEDGEFNLQTVWKFIKIWVDPQIVAGQTKRLIFSWVNDGTLGANPPIAIDNVQFTYQK